MLDQNGAYVKGAIVKMLHQIVFFFGRQRRRARFRSPDKMCIRDSPKEGAPVAAAAVSNVPIINAGDGGHNHPTQTLADLLTIHREKGRFRDITVGFCGDLKFGRTVHYLVSALSRYTGIRLVFISPEELKIPHYIKTDIVEKNHMPYEETRTMERDVYKRQPLTVEDVMNVVTLEQPEGVIASLGGQTAINLADKLGALGVRIIGTDVAAIEKAENREMCIRDRITVGEPMRWH